MEALLLLSAIGTCPDDLSTLRTDAVVSGWSAAGARGLWYEAAYIDVAQVGTASFDLAFTVSKGFFKNKKERRTVTLSVIDGVDEHRRLLPQALDPPVFSSPSPLSFTTLILTSRCIDSSDVPSAFTSVTTGCVPKAAPATSGPRTAVANAIDAGLTSKMPLSTLCSPQVKVSRKPAPAEAVILRVV